MPYAFKDLHWARDIRVNEYLLPKTTAEALEMLAEYQGRAQVVSGGTDVIPRLRKRELEVEALVDITRLPEMDTIEQDDDQIILGGLVTHAQVASSTLIKEKAGLLADGAARVGSPQIRNIGTLAGNLVSGHPAADTSIPLLALNASVTIATTEGERVVQLPQFFLEKGQTAVDCRREIVTQISFPALGKDQGDCYLRLSKRRALTIAILVLAAVVDVDPEQKVFRDAAIALGPVAPIPFRARHTEEMLKGAPLSKETVEMAADNAFAEATPISSVIWGSDEYKREMVKVFVRRGLHRALERAGCPVA
jgi:carbon-monoxide dehydrogenase medium subunit